MTENDEPSLSISQASEYSGMTRETVSRRLSRAGAQPSGSRGGFPVYSVRTIFGVLFKPIGDDGSIDINAISDPFQRKAAVQAEREMLDLAKAKKELIHGLDYELEVARVAKIFSQAVDSIPDVLERDAGLSPAQVQRVEQILDPLREAVADFLSGKNPEQ